MNERREAQRRRVYFGGRIVHERILSDTACLLRNVSENGARLQVTEAASLPHRFDLVIVSRAETRAVEIVWRAADQVGVRFVADDRALDDVAALRASLAASRAEIDEMRARLEAMERHGRPADQALH